MLPAHSMPSIFPQPVRSHITESSTVINSPVLNILAWNIHGEIDWMLCDPELIRLFSSYDVILLQEMWLLPDGHLSLPIPKGYTFWSCSYPKSQDVDRQSGGLAVMFHSEVSIEWCKELSSPECMVLDLPDMTVTLLYLPPPGSPWL